MKTDELPEILTTEEVCAYLRISEKVLRRLRKQGRIALYEANPLMMREWRNRYARKDVMRLKSEAEAQQQRAS